MILRHRRRQSLSEPKCNDNTSIDRNKEVFDEIFRQKTEHMAGECECHSNLRKYADFRSRSSFSLTIFSIPLFGIVLYAILHYLMFFDFNKRVYNHVPGECSYVTGTNRGVVDVHLINNFTLIMSTGTDINNATNSSGAIVLWRINEHESRLFDLRDSKGQLVTLNPYGISFAMGAIMVVNLRRPVKQTDTVEILRIENEKLKRVRKPVSSSMFTSLSDVLALDSQRFYVVNSYYFRRNQLQLLEFTLKTKTGSLFYFDGKKVRKALDGLASSVSGIGIQLNQLFISIPALDEIQVYSIGKTPMDLKLKEIIPVYSAPHFFHFGPMLNEFVVATHPNKIKHLLQKYWPYEFFSPSHVLRFQRTKRGNWRITQYYANDGATITGATIAAQLPGNHLVIGSAKNGLLKCALTSV